MKRVAIVGFGFRGKTHGGARLMKVRASRLAGAVVLVLTAWTAAADVNASVFLSTVRQVAQERGVSLVEAANRLYDVGIRGFDSRFDDKDIPQAVASKLRPVNFYAFVDLFAADNGRAACGRCLDQAERYGVPRVMVIPPAFTDGGDRAAELDRILSGLRFFVAEAEKRAITVMVEDFGNRQNPCSRIVHLKRFLDEVPALKFTLDSGNLRYADLGEDILDLLACAEPRIAHVHLKDQPADAPRRYVSLGLGCVPNEKIVKTLRRDGYAGWYTLENTATGADAFTDIVRQLAVLRLWLREAD